MATSNTNNPKSKTTQAPRQGSKDASKNKTTELLKHQQQERTNNSSAIPVETTLNKHQAKPTTYKTKKKQPNPNPIPIKTKKKVDPRTLSSPNSQTIAAPSRDKKLNIDFKGSNAQI